MNTKSHGVAHKSHIRTAEKEVITNNKAFKNNKKNQRVKLISVPYPLLKPKINNKWEINQNTTKLQRSNIKKRILIVFI